MSAKPTPKPTLADRSGREIAAKLLAMPDAERRAMLAELAPEELAALEYVWPIWARPDQLAPLGDWRTWLLLGGRGAGKTRSACEWIRGEVEAGKRVQIGVIGPTADAVRRVQVEGPSGLLAVCPPWNRPEYEPSTRRIVWPSGAICHLFSAEEPDRLRGPNLDAAWCDEITSWANQETAWDMVQMCLRIPGPLGHRPAALVTTTPKPQPLLKAILADPSTVITRARTSDNAANLDASTLEFYQQRYGGTELGRQELDAEVIEDLAGALWTRATLNRTRVAQHPPLRRIVVAVDPAGGNGAGSDETGIIVAGRDQNGEGYILEDRSGRYTPSEWARQAVAAMHRHKADRIVAEANFGGQMVEGTIRAVDQRAPVKLVRASRGKQVRAEPIAALFEQGKAHIVGRHLALEDQLCGWDPVASTYSPDRLDAMVWACTELLLGNNARPAHRITLEFMQR